MKIGDTVCKLYCNKKLSCRRESVRLASLYRTVQNAFRYVEPLKGVRINHQC